MEIVIRKAVNKDIDILHAFELGIIETERPLEPTLRRDPYHYYNLPKMLEDENATVYVAEVNGRIVGSGNVAIKQSKHYNNISHYAYIGLIYVVPEYRGKNIVHLLMDNIKEWSKSKGITDMRLMVYDKNTVAVKSYEKYGFTKNLVEMRLDI